MPAWSISDGVPSTTLTYAHSRFPSVSGSILNENPSRAVDNKLKLHTAEDSPMTGSSSSIRIHVSADSSNVPSMNSGMAPA